MWKAMEIAVAGTSRTTSMRRGSRCSGSAGSGAAEGVSAGFSIPPNHFSASANIRSSGRSPERERMAFEGRYQRR